MAAPVITEECIMCGACEVDCPVEAIYEGDEGIMVINPEICVECEGYADSPTCVDLCPSEAIVYNG
jgi:ferredoxin